MARRVFHADAKLSPKRWKAVHLLKLLVGEIVDTAVDAETSRDVVTCCQIDQRIARVDDLPRKVVIEALAREISGDVPVHSPIIRIEREISGIDRPAQQTAARKVIRVEVGRIGGRRESPRG